jgi:hypothetical protein
VILPALGQPSNDIGLRDRQRSTIGINRPQQIGELQQCARHEPSQPRRGCERGTSPQHPKSAARCKAAKWQRYEATAIGYSGERGRQLA